MKISVVVIALNEAGNIGPCRALGDVTPGCMKRGMEGCGVDTDICGLACCIAGVVVPGVDACVCAPGALLAVDCTASGGGDGVACR